MAMDALLLSNAGGKDAVSHGLSEVGCSMIQLADVIGESDEYED